MSTAAAPAPDAARSRIKPRRRARPDFAKREHERLLVRHPTCAGRRTNAWNREVAPILAKHRIVLLHVTIAGLAFGGLAGCLSATTETDEPQLLVSRVHTVSITKDSLGRAEDADTPEEALKELLRSDLVVRVGDVGDYTLEYTTRLGVLKTEPVVVAPGLPATITDVDPFAPAKLMKGGQVVLQRNGTSHDWFRVGDVPLGFSLTPGASATYASKGSVTETITLSDLKIPQGDFHIESLKFSLKLPVEGTLGWKMGAQAADGTPMELTTSYGVPAGQGDLVTAEIKAAQEGRSGTAGVTLGVEEALAKGTASIWWKDGQPVAGQLTGASLKLAPAATMWADGFFADMAQGSSCAGKTKADKCKPEEIQTFEHEIDAQEKEDFPVDEYPKASDDADSEKAIRFLRTLFAQDIAQGDKVQIVARFTDDDIPGAPADFTGESQTDFVLEAIGTEKVTVPAGTFETIKIVETFRTRTKTSEIREDGTVYLKPIDIDETMMRTTFWLDQDTYQPIKMVAEMPVDIDRLLKKVLTSISAEAWQQVDMQPIRDDQWRITAAAEASYEATRIDPTTRFSAVMGLGLAHLISSSGASIPVAAMGMAGLPFGEPDYGYAEEIPTRPPMASLSLASDGPLVGGIKSYKVSSVSPGFSWMDIELLLDGETLTQEYAEECLAPEEGGWLACAGLSVEGPWETIDAGDTIRIRAQSGDSLRIVDAYSDATILMMIVN